MTDTTTEALVPAGELAAFGAVMERAQSLLLELSGGVDAIVARAVAAERERIRAAVEDLKVKFWRPGNGPAQTQALEVVPLEGLLGVLDGGEPS